MGRTGHVDVGIEIEFTPAIAVAQHGLAATLAFAPKVPPIVPHALAIDRMTGKFADQGPDHDKTPPQADTPRVCPTVSLLLATLFSLE